MFGCAFASPPPSRSVPLSQVGGGLSVLPLFGLSHSHVDALQPLFSVFLILSLQHVRFTVGEDLEGARQTPVPTLFGYHLQTEQVGGED